MWKNEPRDKIATLSRMHRDLLDSCNGNQVEAKERFIEGIKNDRRFDDLDPSRVAERVAHCRFNGAVFDLDDPQLKAGGQSWEQLRRY